MGENANKRPRVQSLWHGRKDRAELCLGTIVLASWIGFIPESPLSWPATAHAPADQRE
jgi:hypothetical protein